MSQTVLSHLQEVLALTGPWATGPDEEVSLITRIRWAATSADALLRLADSEGAKSEIAGLVSTAATLRECPRRAEKFNLLLTRVDELALAADGASSA